MEPGKKFKGAGAGYFGVGVAFLAIALSGQTSFMGVGMAFIGMGIVFMVKSRKNDGP